MHSLSCTGFGLWHTAFQLSASGQIETTAFFGHSIDSLIPALIIVSSCSGVFFGLLIHLAPLSGVRSKLSDSKPSQMRHDGREPIAAPALSVSVMRARQNGDRLSRG